MFTGLSRSESGNTAALATKFIKSGLHKMAHYVYDPPLSFSKRDSTNTAEVPVDGSMDLLQISVIGTDVELTVTRPDGSSVDSSDSSVSQIVLATGFLEVIESPAPGLWKFTVKSDDECTVSISGRSTLSFTKFDFIEMAGGMHDGWFTTDEVSAPGTNIDIHAVIDGGFATTDFEFRSPSGNTISTVEMAAGTGEDDFTVPANYFYGAATIPSEPFNIYVSGKDFSGNQYQRVLPGILDTVTPPPSNTTNSTSTSSSTSMTMIMTTTTSQAPYGNYSAAGSTTSAWYSNTTTTTTSSATDAATSLCRTVLYHSSWPVTHGGSTTWSVSTVTTTMQVPCYSNCGTALPVISPTCSTLWAGSATQQQEQGAAATKAWPSESPHRTTAAGTATGSASASDRAWGLDSVVPSGVSSPSGSPPSAWDAGVPSGSSSSHVPGPQGSGVATVAAASSVKPSTFTDPYATVTSSPPFSIYTGAGSMLRPRGFVPIIGSIMAVFLL